MSDTVTAPAPVAPMQQIISDANATREVTDSRGRKIKFKRLSALDRIRLLKAVGPDQSRNEPYLGYAMLAGSVIEIGGIPIPFPRDDVGIERAVDILGDEGIEAVATYFRPQVDASAG